MLFSWLLIFCHAIIPHNHLSDDLTHSVNSGHEEKGLQYFSSCDCKADKDACEVSEFLFQKFQNDHFFTDPCYREFAPEKVYSQFYDRFLSGIPKISYSDKSASRAPPAA